MPEPGKG